MGEMSCKKKGGEGEKKIKKIRERKKKENK